MSRRTEHTAFSFSTKEEEQLLLSFDTTRLLHSRPNGVVGASFHHDQSLFERGHHDLSAVWFPWMLSYRVWWSLTALGAILTLYLVPFQIAFSDEPEHFNEDTMITMNHLEDLLTILFAVDILVNFNLAYYKQEHLIFERPLIVREYVHGGKFWIDLLGVIPFEYITLWLKNHFHQNTGDSTTLLMCSLFRLFDFVRLYRMKELSYKIQYDARVSLLWFTLLRNFAAVWALTHLEACSMYFLARLHDFDENTWLGSSVQDMTGFQRYITALYLVRICGYSTTSLFDTRILLVPQLFCFVQSIVTFCTVGYGDFSPVNTTERLWGCVFMLVNVAAAAWIIGSITLLIVKGDEKTGEYRESLQILQQYCEMNHFDDVLTTKLRAQLLLEFNNREVSDENVLQHFPSAVRRKILRRLYLQPLLKTHLMHGIRSQFVDAFLASCTVEIFSPGEEIIERGSILSDLFLLVGGLAQITTGKAGVLSHLRNDADILDQGVLFQTGDFIGDIGFFTESPQIDSVTCLTLCKTLTLSQASYKLLAQDHPSSAGKILQNLLKKVKSQQVSLPKKLEVLRAGSSFDMESISHDSCCNYNSLEDIEPGQGKQRLDSQTAIADLVKMHVDKQLDDQTTRLLFAASRGDTATISLMCDQGFDPNNADYDRRTALMVASMKGNTDVVRLLLEFHVSDQSIEIWIIKLLHSDPFKILSGQSKCY